MPRSKKGNETGVVGIGVCVIFALCLLGYFAKRFHDASAMYQEAEAYQPMVWDLAYEWRGSAAEDGFSPQTWDEIKTAFPELPLHELDPYSPTLHPEDSVILS